MSVLVSVRLVRLRDQIRWIPCSLTQMLILLSGVSYVSWCRVKLAVLSDSLRDFNAAGTSYACWMDLFCLRSAAYLGLLNYLPHNSLSFCHLKVLGLTLELFPL